jgi:hypothetical protein
MKAVSFSEMSVNSVISQWQNSLVPNNITNTVGLYHPEVREAALINISDKEYNIKISLKYASYMADPYFK